MCIRLKRPVLNPQGLPEGFTNKPHFGVFTKKSSKRQQLLCMEGAISSHVLGIPKAKNMICDANISHKIWLKIFLEIFRVQLRNEDLFPNKNI